MTHRLAIVAKQVGLDLIDMNEARAKEMQTWADILAQDSTVEIAKTSAGFINKTVSSGPEMVIDVHALPGKGAVLRTWAIRTKTGDDQKEYFDNIQLTFAVDSRQALQLIIKGRTITRNDLRSLLRSETTQLSAITVCHEVSGDGKRQTNGVRHDLTLDDLRHLSPTDAAKTERVLRTVLEVLRQSSTGR